MKRYLAAILCVAMVLSLAACGITPEETTLPTTIPTATTIPVTEPTTEPTEPTVPETTLDISNLPLLSTAAITLTEETEQAEGVQFEYRYPNVRLTLQDWAIADTVMLDLLNRIDATRSTADSILSSAGNDMLYFYDVHYDPMRIDPNVLSLYGSESCYAGGAHPSHESISVTYDLTTGKVLLLSDLLNPGCTAADLTPLVIEILDAISQEQYLYSDYTATVEERFGQGLDVEDGWYLSNEGLCIFFSPYEIAPYATGEVKATIPYEKLNGLLRDAFFPVEKSGGVGVVNATLWTEAAQTDFEQFYDVTIDHEGEVILLSTNGLVYDLTLEYGYWDSEGTVFYPTATVFAASSLSFSEAVILRLFIPDVLSNMRLTYTTDEGTIQKYIFQSGMDGSILLLDN